jgi:hypothetical protein
MASRNARGRGARAILAAGLFALLAASFSAYAGPGDAPVLRKSSVASGWSKSDFVISADFDKLLAATSTITVTRVSAPAGPVAGSTTVAQTGIAFIAGSALASTDGTVYQVDVSASGIEGTPSTAYTKTFKVDTRIPKPPVVTSPEGIGLDGAPPFDASVVPGTIETFDGRAFDAKGANDVTVATSGIQRIELRFWSVVDQVLSLPSFDADYSFKHSVDMTCGGTCPADVDPWSVAAADITDLGTGVWSVRAIAFDLAGNQSGPTKPIVFVNA